MMTMAQTVDLLMFSLRTGTTWTEQAKLTASDGAADDQFGLSVAIVVTQLWWEPMEMMTMASASGSAYVFTRTGTTWTQQAQLTASDGASTDEFGMSVAIAGDTIVVGAYLDDNDNGADSGSAYIYDLN